MKHSNIFLKPLIIIVSIFLISPCFYFASSIFTSGGNAPKTQDFMRKNFVQSGYDSSSNNQIYLLGYGRTRNSIIKFVFNNMIQNISNTVLNLNPW